MRIVHVLQTRKRLNSQFKAMNNGTGIKNLQLGFQALAFFFFGKAGFQLGSDYKVNILLPRAPL